MRVEDLAALQHMVDSGVDPDTVCPFEHFLYFDDARLAGFAALAFQEVGYPTEVEPASGGGWLLVVYTYHCPRASELERHIAFIEQVAQSFGGEYDGWGVPVKR